MTPRDPSTGVDPPSDETSRRGFIKTAAAAGVVVSLGSAERFAGAQPASPAAAALPSAPAASSVPISVTINGAARKVDVDPRTSLLDLLRDRLDLTGTKLGCNQGACGACTLLVDGERINSCLALAVQYDGRSITTIEGVGQPGNLHPLQQAFLEHDGFQCGYCTPGQVCSAIGMASELKRGVPSAVSGDVAAGSYVLDGVECRERMSGNLCRCGAYNGIVAAVRQTFGGDAAGKEATR